MTKGIRVGAIEQPSKMDEHKTESEPSWISHTINEAWSSVEGGTRVAAGVATGVAKHVVAHPLETAVEVGAGVVAAGAIAEAGIGVSAATAIAAVPMAAYGTYRGIDIARSEGIGAIPGHLKQTYNDAISTAASIAKAIGAVYNGTADTKAMAKVESLGDAATPLIAGGIGASSTLLGRQVIRGAYTGLEMLTEQMLPRAPQLAPAFIDGFPKLPASLSMLADVPTASTASLAIGDGSITLHSQSSHGSGDHDQIAAIRDQSRSPEAEIRFQDALKRLDNVATRKAEAAERAKRIGWRQVKITEYPDTHHVDVEARDSSKFSLARVEEDSSGRKVEDYHAEHPYISKRVVEEPDGTMTTTTVRDDEWHGAKTTLTRIEHNNGDLEVTSIGGPRDITEGRYEHLDGSVASWSDDNEVHEMRHTWQTKDGHISSEHDPLEEDNYENRVRLWQLKGWPLDTM